MIKLIIIIFLFSQLTYAKIPIELEILTQNGKTPTIDYLNQCSNCLQHEKIIACPESINFFTDQTISNTLYNLLNGNKLIDTCFSNININKNDYAHTENTIKKILGHSFFIHQKNIDACLKINNINFNRIKNNKENIEKIIASYQHVLIKNIDENQKNQIQEIASIDSLLKVPLLDKFNCRPKHKDFCESLNQCSNNQEFDEISGFSLETLYEISILEKQRDELWRLRVNGKISPKDSSEATIDINNKIKLLKNLLPWFKGDILKNTQASIIAKLKQNNFDLAKKQFEEKFREQLIDARKELLLKYNSNSVSLNCLVENIGCSTKTLKNLNENIVKDFSFKNFSPENFQKSNLHHNISYSDFLEANQLLSASYCISDLLKDKKEIDDIAFMVASTGASFAVGGVGGVLRLGQIALKFYQTENRAKGISSLALLGAEAASINKNFQDISNECEKQIHNLENESQKNSSNICLSNSSSIYKISKLKSCVANISLTTLPYALSLRSAPKKPDPLPYYAKELSENNLEKSYFLSKINNDFISNEEKEIISAALSKIKLTTDESNEIIKNLNTIIKNDKDKNRLKNYINYVLSLKPSEQKPAILKLNEVVLVSNHFNPGGYVQQFYAKENKFYLYEKYKSEYLTKKLELEGKSSAVAKAEAEIMARKGRLELQKKFYACQSKTMTPEHIAAAKKYAIFTGIMGITGTSFGFYNNNKPLLENNPEEFYGKLSYEIAMTYLITKINAKIMTNPEGSLAHKYVSTNLSSAGLGSIDASIYSKLYGVTEDEARIKVEAILSSKEAKKELEILDKYIAKENLVEKFENTFIDAYKKIVTSKEKDQLSDNLGPSLDQFSNLNEEELNKPETKEKLVKAALLHLNSGNMSAFLTSGDKGFDRWVNDRTWNAAIGVPKGIVMGYTIYQILCLGADSPYKSLGLAFGIQSVNQLLSGDGYYRFRQEFIGQ